MSEREHIVNAIITLFANADTTNRQIRYVTRHENACLIELESIRDGSITVIQVM